jgi:phosphoribosylanthranilate isomerase
VKHRFRRPVMKAIAVAAPEEVLAAARYDEVADMLLFDAKPPRREDALPGGNGLAFDWHLIAGHSWRRPWMLSGGLTAQLLPEAVRISGASAVDVSSGVERSPGDKDPDKIREFLRVAHAL